MVEFGATINNKDGNTRTDAANAIAIIAAVSNPYEENIGIGAKAIMINPPMEDAAEAASAIPVPCIENFRAISRELNV